jgi:hypothetical protein
MSEATHPRVHIRQYLLSLLTALDLDPAEVESWPHVSPETYFEAVTRVRNGTAHLLQFHRQNEHVDFETGFYIELYGAVAADYLRLDWSQPEIAPEPEIPEDWFDGRPGAQIDVFNQQYCTEPSSLRRARRVVEEIGPSEGKVLLLGDDDLVSIALARVFRGEIHMLDIDERVLEFVGEKAPQVERRIVDLSKITMPEDMVGAYDVVLLDPHWFYAGAVEFLEKAILFLKDEPHARILMSQCPHFSLGEQGRFHRWITRHKMKFERIDPWFNWYDLSLLAEPSACSRLLELEKAFPSALLKALAPMPYGFSHLYTLSRAEKPEKGRWWKIIKHLFSLMLPKSREEKSSTTFT